MALIHDLTICPACQTPIISTAGCAACTHARQQCVDLEQMGTCPICWDGNQVNLYVSLDQLERPPLCLYHMVLATRTEHEQRRADRRHIGDVRHLRRVT